MRRAAILVGLIATAVCPSGAAAGPNQTSIFQDDAHLVYAAPATVQRTLSTLSALGVTQIRVTLKWADVAPAAGSRQAPHGFEAGNQSATSPASYPAAGWASYDRLVRYAARLGISVMMNLTAPGPLWAMGFHPPSARAADHFEPSAGDFGAFAQAAGTRYSGQYAGLPRVGTWSIWNEPNQPGWLAPQWRRVRAAWTPSSPTLYRQLADAAYLGLSRSGHAHDTVLIGETAPEGSSARGSLVAMKPLPFLRGLYCVDGHYHRLRGSTATPYGCPAGGSALSFALANGGLFRASGFGHHPYLFSAAPDAGTRDPDIAPLANLSRLERALDATFAAYGLSLHLPVYLTEYGYQTRPPDPHVNVSPVQQAAYLNAADHLAWRDPRVRSMAQFLLRDDGPDRRYRPTQFKFWDTFQTGLEFANGKPKPALAAYRLPLWVSGHAVWGQVRPAARLGAQRVRIQWQAQSGGAFRTLAGATTTASGFLDQTLRFPGPGHLRLLWHPPGGRAFTSRIVRVP